MTTRTCNPISPGNHVCDDVRGSEKQQKAVFVVVVDFATCNKQSSSVEKIENVEVYKDLKVSSRKLVSR